MKKINVGITGQAGFVGTHLYNELGLFPDAFERIPFEDAYFDQPKTLACFLGQCDVVVHLAAVNRYPDENELYKKNVDLVNRLINALIQGKARPHVIFSSSTQESLDNSYGRSKREGRRLLETWAKNNLASFTGMIVPNVYGAFGRPQYNSFIATFCHKLIHGEKPTIINDNEVNLIYVSSLCKDILSDIRDVQLSDSPVIKEIYIEPDITQKVSEVLDILRYFKEDYFDAGIIPALDNSDAVNLFNTFRSYIELDNYFPRKLKQNTDNRGMFVETVKLGMGGQVSLSTTRPGITRGNHFHTRKIERFAVIKGQAKIQLRRIGTDRVFEFCLSGNSPSYVDMPIWYTHNITNIGSDELYTQFWINEWYDESNSDTFFEQV
ncbi:MAG: NAD-dependent epimerase/dehydratase family protein [Bacteroidales bacterium]|jgi:UDP-2-acetamido-2,6-beta-L-arabino-hexul-4-ose reductase|nr:NAD-dependent epimerase/dehydratase family protein [Bacteroidales bacterium]